MRQPVIQMDQRVKRRIHVDKDLSKPFDEKDGLVAMNNANEPIADSAPASFANTNVGVLGYF